MADRPKLSGFAVAGSGFVKPAPSVPPSYTSRVNQGKPKGTMGAVKGKAATPMPKVGKALPKAVVGRKHCCLPKRSAKLMP